jgi:hypothetical protein
MDNFRRRSMRHIDTLKHQEPGPLSQWAADKLLSDELEAIAEREEYFVLKSYMAAEAKIEPVAAYYAAIVVDMVKRANALRAQMGGGAQR